MNSIDYWVQLGVSQVWALVIAAAICAFGAGMGFMRLINASQISALRERKELAEERVEQVRDKAFNDQKAAEGVGAEVASLRTLFERRASGAEITAALKSIEGGTRALVESTSRTMTFIDAGLFRNENVFYPPTVAGDEKEQQLIYPPEESGRYLP